MTRPKVRLRSLTAISIAVVVLTPTPASAARPDADHFDAYFATGDGTTMLHAEVLRPKGLSLRVRTPVIMTVSPYFNRNDLIDPQETGPQRFYDFLDLTGVLDRGYTYVMVDLPGFGGSGGCNDWGGAREQGAVKAAVEWAAGQRWSSGKVGLMGKSYDAWTGLMAIARRPRGLAAVVAMEPVYSGYRYLYTDGVRYSNSQSTPLIFQLLDAQPGDPSAPAQYHLNGAPQAWCYGINVVLQQQDDPDVGFWKERDLALASKRRTTPLFLTQGFLEDNTTPDGAYDYFEGLAGRNRAWFGQFGHVRGWQRQDGRYLTGRSVFVAEMMRFFDRHLKRASVRTDPQVVVQDNKGRYRAEQRWPPPDTRVLWNDLNAGVYTDDGNNVGSGSGGGNGIWSFSQALPYDVWMTGEPVLRVDVDTLVPRANLVADLYDVAPGGRAILVSRGAHLLRAAGAQRGTVELHGQDWVFVKGHRLGVLVTAANREWWAHVPTLTTVSVRSAQVSLPFLGRQRHRFLDGRATPGLENHLDLAFVTVSRETVLAGRRTFRLPAPLD